MSSSYSAVQKSFLKYQHVFVFAAPVVFVAAVLAFAPTTGSGTGYWLEYWWLFPAFLTGATIVNTVGISGSALFVPFLIFVFPLAAQPLSPQTIVKVGLISEAFGLSSSSVAFVQYGLVDRRLALTIVGGAVPFVIAGAILSFVVPEPVFHGLLGLALIAASILLFKADLDHEGAESDADGGHETAADGGSSAAPDGGTADLPDDAGKLGPAGVRTDEDGTVTRVDRDGDDYRYTRGGYLKRFGNYSIGGMFQGLAGFGAGELGIISMLSTKVPVRVAIGTNHIIVAVTAVLASLVHVFGGTVLSAAGIHIPGVHGLSLASTPWNMVVFTVPATVTGGQIAPYVSNALETDTIKTFVGGLFAIIAIALFGMAMGGI
ncbi:sulfite exporter TauE/SafE family protein [Halosimplex pelagicum]|uniref:Probable membrane transporter protein n=1 Tax=Halosimplex pelagicum TaxID=869886 RepID=A0A7D5TQ58_9EURY|nr:sulfite exporter TauE/SafE family protein [Halosimplex pelagicum]QLH80232.1 sulfite exporter TauE/SafE family protein [Halosimplex pelagicum]